MKKIVIVILTFFICVSFFANPTIEAAETKASSVAIPITTGLVGSNNSAKTFYLDLPAGVSSATVKTGTLKYNGTNEAVGEATLENGKIKVTLKGKSNVKLLSGVLGYRYSFEENFRLNPGNSIWRYSDGRRWQINEYNEATNGMKTFDRSGDDGNTPSADPPHLYVTAAPLMDTSYLKWYNGSQTEVIDAQDIIQSTVKPVYDHGSPYIKDQPKFKNGRVIVNYYIPYYTLKDKMYLTYENQEADATHPLVGHATGRMYDVDVFYYFKADAKVTSYSYGGTVTFDSSLPTEPTLTGNAVVLQPIPNPTKFENKDIPVQLSLKGELAAYTNTSNISEWIFYAKDPVDGKLQTKKEYGKVLSGDRSFDFTIPKARITKDNYEQKYDLTVVVRFSKPVATKTGNITSLQESFTLGVEVYKKDPPIVLPNDPPPASKLLPPVPVLDTPDEVMAGEEFMAYGDASYDPDGRIVEYKWSTTNAMKKISGPHGDTWYDLSQLGTQRITLRVIDNDGLGKSTSNKIKVINPVPEASLEIGGSKKENRKVTLKNTSTSPVHYPLVAEKTQFSLEAVSGGTDAAIKYKGTLAGFMEKDVLFKKAGTYKATITVTNTAGFSNSTSVTFDIVPDQPPVVYFSAPNKVYRTPEEGNRANVSLSDLSFSTDYDFIGRRIWEYRYDSNNNGSFLDEAWVIFSNENKDQLNLPLQEVGRYEIRLTVVEEFDQPTIPEFITEAERRSADSYTSQPPQAVIERIVDVVNRAPEVDWSW